MKRSPMFCVRTIGEQAMLVPLGSQVKTSNGVISLNSCGIEIWYFLENDHTIDDIIEHIVDIFDIDTVVARSDVVSFISSMQSLGLLQ